MSEAKTQRGSRKPDLVAGKYHSYGRVKLPSGKYRDATPEDYAKKNQFLLVEPVVDESKRRIYKEGGVKRSIVSRFGDKMYAFLLDERLVGLPEDLEAFLGRRVNLSDSRVIYFGGRFADKDALSSAVDARIAELGMVRKIDRKVVSVEDGWKKDHGAGITSDELKTIVEELKQHRSAVRKAMPKRKSTGKKSKKEGSKKEGSKKKGAGSKKSKKTTGKKSKSKKSKSSKSEEVKTVESKESENVESKESEKVQKKDSKKKDSEKKDSEKQAKPKTASRKTKKTEERARTPSPVSRRGRE